MAAGRPGSHPRDLIPQYRAALRGGSAVSSLARYTGGMADNPYGGGALGGGSSSGGGGSSSGGGGGSGPSSGSSGGSSGSGSSGGGSSSSSGSSGPTAAEKAAQFKQDVKSAKGWVTDVYLQILGRRPSQQELRQFVRSGLGSYALQQQLYMSKEYRRTADYHRRSTALQMQVATLFGGRLNVKPRLLQSWIAKGYTAEDVQTWMWKHPHVFRQSNVYQDRLAQLQDVYSQTLGVNYALQDQTKAVGHRVDTNKKKPGIQGHRIAYRDIPTALHRHLDAAAFNFQDPEKYREHLMKTPEYAALVKHRSGVEQQQGTQVDVRGRPLLGPERLQQDVSA